MKIKVLKDRKFDDLLRNSGESIDEIEETGAFAERKIAYFRESTPIEEFFSEIIHEGTHILDELQIDRIFGNNWSFEKRAFFHERAFQKASGMNFEFSTIEEMLDFIFKKYKQF